jgi:2-polyprenyl-6-methoxyphenol hydroxylase-like FAD-dependent oxidoreductase
VLQLPNVDRDPIPRWSFGRVTLIGDAAHPMQPVGAQAGSQAVVDARVLAASILVHRDPVEALARYEDRRIKAMNDIIIRNRNLGLETVLQLAERAPNSFARPTCSAGRAESAALASRRSRARREAINSRDPSSSWRVRVSVGSAQ